MTRKREHRMTVRLNGDEYTKVLSKIERSGNRAGKCCRCP